MHCALQLVAKEKINLVKLTVAGGGFTVHNIILIISCTGGICLSGCQSPMQQGTCSFMGQTLVRSVRVWPARLRHLCQIWFHIEKSELSLSRSFSPLHLPPSPPFFPLPYPPPYPPLLSSLSLLSVHVIHVRNWN